MPAKTPNQLINNITGQLNGISKMIEEEKECFEVIIQLKAVKSSLNTLMNRYIESNFVNCIKSCGNKKQEEMIKKLVLELTKNN
jgi:DNA-binding FrmR family transcriptional regulator